MQTGHKRWTAFASAAAAVAAIGCGDLTTDTASGGAGDPSVETKASAVAPRPRRVLEPRTRFFIPPPNPGAVQQIVDLAKGRKLIDAARITAMEATPHAVWFTDGSPSDVKAAVRKTVKAAALLHTVPVLVAYNIPFRDCAQYSAGGALDTAAYEAWIDGFAAGIGNAAGGRHPRARRPRHHPLYNGDWCQPTVTDAAVPAVRRPGADPATRYALLNYAVDKLAASAPQRARLPRRHAQRLAGRRRHREPPGERPAWRAPTGFFLNMLELPVRRRTSRSTAPGSRAASRTPPRSRPATSGRARTSTGTAARTPSMIAEINGEWNGAALDRERHSGATRPIPSR